MTPHPPETRFELKVEVSRDKDHILVWIIDKQENSTSRWFQRVYPPNWLDKLLRRTWDDKAWNAIYEARLQSDKLRDNARTIETIGAKAEEIVKQMGVNLDGND
jgi:hypothetical protein